MIFIYGQFSWNDQQRRREWLTSFLVDMIDQHSGLLGGNNICIIMMKIYAVIKEIVNVL